MVELDSRQLTAAYALKKGSVLFGGVGSGKSRTALYHALAVVMGARFKLNGHGHDDYPTDPKELVILTTAKKRDSLEWEAELARFGVAVDETGGLLGRPCTVDSWNNIKKYITRKDCVFILDEQKLVGSGAWTWSFYRIARHNYWFLLSGTPGDQWTDYIPLFVANGFYNSRAEFLRTHAVYNTYANYPKIDRWIGEETLEKFRSKILVELEYASLNTRHVIEVPCTYDEALMERVVKDRWNPWKERPIKDAGELFRCMRRVTNSDWSREIALTGVLVKSRRVIVYYTFNYELELIRGVLKACDRSWSEWNGSTHDAPPDGEEWVYLVQYGAGAEGWEEKIADTMVFWSLSYSYKQYEQAQGRIDRRDHFGRDLYYYVLRSQASIDRAIWSALVRKRVFNERTFYRRLDGNR